MGVHAYLSEAFVYYANLVWAHRKTPLANIESMAKGAIILAPPGTGKSYWLKHHPDSGWLEGDDLYPEQYLERERTLEDQRELEKLNILFRDQGKRVLTGDWYVLRGVDAIVTRDKDQVLENLRISGQRPGHDIDVSHELIMEYWSIHKKRTGVPIPVFSSIDAAVCFLEEERDPV